MKVILDELIRDGVQTVEVLTRCINSDLFTGSLPNGVIQNTMDFISRVRKVYETNTIDKQTSDKLTTLFLEAMYGLIELQSRIITEFVPTTVGCITDNRKGGGESLNAGSLLNISPYESLSKMVATNFMNIAPYYGRYIDGVHHGFMDGNDLYITKDSLESIMKGWYMQLCEYTYRYILDDLENNNCIKIHKSSAGRIYRTHHFNVKYHPVVSSKRWVVIYLNSLIDYNKKR